MTKKGVTMKRRWDRDTYIVVPQAYDTSQGHPMMNTMQCNLHLFFYSKAGQSVALSMMIRLSSRARNLELVDWTAVNHVKAEKASQAECVPRHKLEKRNINSQQYPG